MKEESKPAPATARRGTNGRAVLKIGGPQWQEWLRYYQAAGDTQRAGLMWHMADSSRRGEWEEPAEWPPTRVGPRDNGPRQGNGNVPDDTLYIPEFLRR